MNWQNKHNIPLFFEKPKHTTLGGPRRPQLQQFDTVKSLNCLYGTRFSFSASPPALLTEHFGSNEALWSQPTLSSHGHVCSLLPSEPWAPDTAFPSKRTRAVSETLSSSTSAFLLSTASFFICSLAWCSSFFHLRDLVFQDHHVLNDSFPNFFGSSNNQLLLALHGLQKPASLLFHVLDGLLQVSLIPVQIFLQGFEESSYLRHFYPLIYFEHRKLLASSFFTRSLRERQNADRIILWAEQEMLQFVTSMEGSRQIGSPSSGGGAGWWWSSVPHTFRICLNWRPLGHRLRLLDIHLFHTSTCHWHCASQAEKGLRRTTIAPPS